MRIYSNQARKIVSLQDLVAVLISRDFYRHRIAWRQLGTVGLGSSVAVCARVGPQVPGWLVLDTKKSPKVRSQSQSSTS